LALTVGVEKLFKQLDLEGVLVLFANPQFWTVFKAFEILHNRILKGDLLSGCCLQCYNPCCFEFLKDIGLYLITANFCINPGLFLLVVISVDSYTTVFNVITTLSQEQVQYTFARVNRMELQESL
jgi:hypothetical protein